MPSGCYWGWWIQAEPYRARCWRPQACLRRLRSPCLPCLDCSARRSPSFGFANPWFRSEFPSSPRPYPCCRQPVRPASPKLRYPHCRFLRLLLHLTPPLRLPGPKPSSRTRIVLLSEESVSVSCCSFPPCWQIRNAANVPMEPAKRGDALTYEQSRAAAVSTPLTEAGQSYNQSSQQLYRLGTFRPSRLGVSPGSGLQLRSSCLWFAS